MHQQEVGGVLALADLLRNTGGHRNSGNTSGADQGVDLTAGQGVHHLAAQNACSGTKGEGDQTQHNDEQGAAVQEGVCRGGAANRQSQENGDDVHQFIAGSLLDTIHNTGLLHQVAQHQHTDQNGSIGNDQRNNDGDHDGEDDPLGLGHGAQLLHHDCALFLGGERLHNGRLDHGHQSHVAVRRNGNAAQQLRCQTGGNEDGGGAVCTADDGDCSGLLLGEVHNTGSGQQTSAHISTKDTELSGSAQQQALGVGDQGGEVGHGADAQEDQRGVNAQLDTHVKHIGQTAVIQDLDPHRVLKTITNEVLHVDNAAAGQVGKDHAKCHGQQDQGLKFLYDGQVQQEAAHADHDRVEVAARLTEPCKAGTLENTDQSIDKLCHVFPPVLKRCGGVVDTSLAPAICSTAHGLQGVLAIAHGMDGSHNCGNHIAGNAFLHHRGGSSLLHGGSGLCGSLGSCRLLACLLLGGHTVEDLAFQRDDEHQQDEDGKHQHDTGNGDNHIRTQIHGLPPNNNLLRTPEQTPARKKRFENIIQYFPT